VCVSPITGYDVRRRVAGNFLYEVPLCGPGKPCFGPAGRALLGGWQVNGIVQAQSGFPFTVLLASSTANNGRSTRPNVVAGVSPYVPDGERSAARWINPAAFSLLAPFTTGNAGVNNLIGPGMSQVDCSILKNAALRENWKLQFRGEFFNVLNHVNFGTPNSSLGSSGFGTITTQATTPLQIQFGLKLLF